MSGKPDEAATVGTSADSGGGPAEVISDVADKVAGGIDDVRERSADLLSEATDAIAGTAASGAGAAADAFDSAGKAVDETVRQARRRARRAAAQGQAATRDLGRSTAQLLDHHPALIGLLGFVGGFVLGAAFPPTRMETRAVGELGDRLAKGGAEVVRDATHQAERGLDVARQAVRDELAR